MADYTTITDAQVDPEAPITSELMSALRDNPTAIAEGASGAPRIVADANQGSVAGSTLLFGLSGVTYQFGPTESFIHDAAFKATTNCQVRVSAQYRRVGPYGLNVTLRIYKNGTAVLTQTKSSTNYSTHTVDITLSAGDCVRISGQGGTDGGNIDFIDITGIQYLTGTQRSVGGI